jgi:hypothetical protein
MEDNMTQQTFTVGAAPKVAITRVSGDLNVSAWGQQAISVDTDRNAVELRQEGDLLTINNCHGDIELEVPADTSISITNLSGDATIAGIRRVEMWNASGDVEVEDISEAVELGNLSSDLTVSNTPALRVRGSVGGDVSLSGTALVEIETVGSDLSLEDAETVIVGTVGSDLNAHDVSAALRCGTVGSDCQVEGGADTEITIGMIGSDLQVNGAGHVQVGTVGSDCEIRDVQGAVEVGQVGSDGNINNVGGDLQLGNIGGDAVLKDLGGNIEVGAIGGDMELQATFPAGRRTRMNVGGDAVVVLPANPNLSVRAAVAGDISGRSINYGSGRSGNMINLVYGDGSAQLELNVGGDLQVRGYGDPRSSNVNVSWGEFGREMAELGREMSKMGQELSREMAKLGEELGRELSDAFSEAGWSRGAGWADEVARKVNERARRAQRHADEQMRRADEQMRRANERAQQAEERNRQHAGRQQGNGERASRAYIRINDREWRLDPDRLERIKEQARRAAAEGVSGALEAVERAISNLRIPVPPVPPLPPVPPVPAVPPVPGAPVPPTPPAASRPANVPVEEKAAGGTTSGETPAQQPAGDISATASNVPEPNPEQERIAILRMIAEGRITPEEGDLLIEALGS